jgi:hypothetical protein
MIQKTMILSFLVAAILIGCNNEQDKKVQINPIDQLELVDDLLKEISEKPQQLTARSDKATTVRGAKGTVIYVDPNRLETIDGSPLGHNIQIELLEMTDNSSMLLNNTQTVSNGQILVTGGAYYLNMTSDGKQLKINQGKGLDIEFPKLTENEMSIFYGQRDSLGQMNWVQAEQNFKSKDLEAPKNPKSKKIAEKETKSEIELILGYIENKEVEEPLTQEEINEYEIQRREFKAASKTYESIELMNFGWINCDRFWDDPSPKTNIHLLVNDDSLSGARIYAIFSDIKSIMTAFYWRGMKDIVSLNDIPIGKELTIIAISAKGETPFVFETTIVSAAEQQVQIEFTATTPADLKEKIKRLN